jgi:hypothetical protein
LARKTAVAPPAPGIGTDRQRDGVNHLGRGRSIATPPYQAALDRGLKLPAVWRRAVRRGCAA